ncbi:DUF2593 family protein [Rouxiella sp. S1S-2]|uniref:YbjO family protein n=1 Tax=Rouxiella sp. S1S-2 TaxID=2653856 RepID=UPI001265820F|nr:YbjO family protein [Rouxiella sp. S1S-2]KAB7896997.1 DUF2593 family protein [Rouxiella sp. S1S-2]
MKLAFIPVPVMAGATAIIATRLLEFVLLFDAYGYVGVKELLSVGSESWFNSFIMLAGLLIVLLECQCAYAMMRGSSWSRRVFLACQLLSVIYLFCASEEWIGPMLFRLDFNTTPQLIAELMQRKVPDLAVLLLIYVPFSSRRFFRRDK